MGDYDTLRAEYDQHMRKTEDWKVKMKAITIKDRQEILRLKEECEQLKRQIETMGAISREKDGEIAKRQADVDKMRRTMEEVNEKASSLQSMQDSLNNALLQKEGMQQQLSKREAEVLQLRARATELSDELEETRGILDGAPYFTEAEAPTLQLVKLISHASSQWVLCTSQTHPPRWFDEDLLRIKIGSERVNELLPEPYEATLLSDHGARSDAQIAGLEEALSTAQDEHRRSLTFKQGEIDSLLRRIDTLQSAHSQALDHEKQQDAEKLHSCRSEMELAIEEKFQSLVSRLEDEVGDLEGKLKRASAERDQLRQEFTQYKVRAQRAAAKRGSSTASDAAAPSTPVSDAAASPCDAPLGAPASRANSYSTVAVDLEKLEAENQALKHARDTLELTTQTLQGRCTALQAEVDRASTQTAEACEALQDSERARHAAVRECAELRAEAEVASLKRRKPLDDPTSRAAPQAAAAPCEACKALEAELCGTKEHLAACKSALQSLKEELAREDLRMHTPQHAPAPQHTPAPQPPPDAPEPESAAVAETPQTASLSTPPDIVVTTPRLSRTTKCDPAQEEGRTEAAHAVADGDAPTRDMPSSNSLADLVDDDALVGATFEVDDLVSAIDTGCDAPSWAMQKLKRTVRELSETKKKLTHLHSLTDENKRLRAIVVDLEQSLSRIDSGARTMDYLKNTVVNFCLAKEQPEVQSAMVPLLSSLLSLPPDEHAKLAERYPPC